jgi:hypothetical protein
MVLICGMYAGEPYCYWLGLMEFFSCSMHVGGTRGCGEPIMVEGQGVMRVLYA